jgi:hypothetical protein
MRLELKDPAPLACPECGKPFEPLGFGHLESCRIGRKYKLPQLVTTGHHALVFGSRVVPLGRHPEAHAMLDRLHWEHPDLVIIKGGARGADHVGKTWADGHQVAVETWRPQWGLFHGWLAAFWRNAEMAARKPQEAVALIGPCEKEAHREWAPHPSHGSTDMAMRLRQLDIPMLVHTWGIPAAWGEALRTKEQQ